MKEGGEHFKADHPAAALGDFVDVVSHDDEGKNRADHNENGNRVVAFLTLAVVIELVSLARHDDARKSIVSEETLRAGDTPLLPFKTEGRRSEGARQAGIRGSSTVLASTAVSTSV